jgi:hypothetical protein
VHNSKPAFANRRLPRYLNIRKIKPSRHRTATTPSESNHAGFVSRQHAGSSSHSPLYQSAILLTLANSAAPWYHAFEAGSSGQMLDVRPSAIWLSRSMRQSRLPGANHDGLTIPLITCPVIWGSILRLLACWANDQGRHHQVDEGTSAVVGRSVELGRCLGIESTKGNTAQRLEARHRRSRGGRGPGFRFTTCHEDMVVNMGARVHHTLNTAHLGGFEEFFGRREVFNNMSTYKLGWYRCTYFGRGLDGPKGATNTRKVVETLFPKGGLQRR